MNKTFWQEFKIPKFAGAAGKISTNQHFDTIVVGGGITGLTAAYFLKRAGQKVCLLERDRLGAGDTGHTTAHLNTFIDVKGQDLIKLVGEDNARLVLEGGTTAIDWIEKISEELGIDCSFQRVPGFRHAPLMWSDSEDINQDDGGSSWDFKEEVEATQKLGFDCEFEHSIPGANLPGIRFPNQAIFHPLKFLVGLAKFIDGDGSAIYEQSEVTEVKSNPLTVSGEGFSLACDYLVVATHVPLTGKTNIISSTLFQTKIAPYSSYVLGGTLPHGILPHVSASDTSDPYYYWRVEHRAKSDYVIFGGRDHKTGQVIDTDIRFAELEKAFRKLAPQIDIKHRWSGQVIETHDGLPFIGEISKEQFIATGFTGNGITFGVLSGLMASDAAMKRPNPWRNLFAPSRVELDAKSLKDYFKENIDYPSYMAKQYLTPTPKGSPDSLKEGEGQVMKVDGKRMACSRDANGTLHTVSAVCTHMGCLVQWNGGEQTWDCPCHGSRFHPSGKVLAGPAETALKVFEVSSSKEKPEDQTQTAAN